jgi:anti-sigma factor RsiW
MSNTNLGQACQTIDPLVTPYVDGELSQPDRQRVDEHLRLCGPCRSRVAAEGAVHRLLAARRGQLAGAPPPEALRARCVACARSSGPPAGRAFERTGRGAWPAAVGRRAAPLAMAASLVLLVGGAFLYQLTESSSRVLAAELAADHVKCFAMNGVLHTQESPAAVESSMLTGFDWRMRLPEGASRAGLELVGARPCLYGEGRIAHIMYRHHGEPVSLFMLPRSARPQEVVHVLGHDACIWCVGNRTFVLVTREPREEVDRIASLVQASLK